MSQRMTMRKLTYLTRARPPARMAWGMNLHQTSRENLSINCLVWAQKAGWRFMDLEPHSDKTCGLVWKKSQINCFFLLLLSIDRKLSRTSIVSSDINIAERGGGKTNFKCFSISFFLSLNRAIVVGV